MDNRDLWSDPNDPMLKILFQLGGYIPREQRYHRADNRQVTLHLHVPKTFVESEESGGGKPDSLFIFGKQDAILKETFDSLQNFANQINMEQYENLSSKQ